MTAKRGPELAQELGPELEATADRVSFRFITVYRVGTDDLVARLDVKRGGEQYNVGLFISLRGPQPGSSLRDPNAPLALPSKGVEQCAGGEVDRLTLVRAMRDLIEVLE